MHGDAAPWLQRFLRCSRLALSRRSSPRDYAALRDTATHLTSLSAGAAPWLQRISSVAVDPEEICFGKRVGATIAMELKLTLCVIRPWRLDDAVALQRHANNRKIWLNLRDLFPHPYSLDDARKFLDRVVNEKPTTTFAIATSEVIGAIGLRIGCDVHRKTAELGYWLGEPFWGQGIMSEAVAEFSRFAFTTFDIDRTYAEPFANNPASARVLEKAGFVCEGNLRWNVLKDGKRLDSLLYAKIR